MTSGGAPPAPLRVVARDEDAEPGALDALIAALDRRPGVFYGCDYESEPLYRRRSSAFADPALRVVLDAGDARIEPLDAAGRVLARHWASFVAGRWDGDVWRPTLVAAAGAAAHPFIAVLRRLAAAFDTRDAPGFGFHGAWSFEHWRLRDPEASGRTARVVLYLPLLVLRSDGSASRWRRFAIEGVPEVEPAPADAASASRARVVPRRDGDDFAPGGYAARLAAAIGRIQAGDVVSLTMTQAFRRPFAADAAPIFTAMRRRYPMPEMFFANFGGGEHLLGASPDLQIRIADGAVDCAPACGTLRRGGDALEDAALGRALLTSAKEAAALALCSDAFAERLRSVCAPGTVGLVSRQRIHFFATVIHGVDHLRGTLAAGRDAYDALLATAAPPTVSGVPEAAALAAISELEGSAREWFGGAIGQVGFDGALQLGTILRFAWLHDGLVELRTGGVVVSHSTPAAEEEESRLKARTLLDLLGVGEAAASTPSIALVASDTRHPVRIDAAGDPFRHSLLDALVAAGAVLVDGASGEAAIRVVVAIRARVAPVGALRDAVAAGEPLLLVGGAALALLLDDGAATHALVPPQDGFTVAIEPAPSCPLLGRIGFAAALYAEREVRLADLPPAYEVAARSGDAVMAYRHRTKPIVGLVYRPESTLSGRGARDALASALAVLAAALPATPRTTP